MSLVRLALILMSLYSSAAAGDRRCCHQWALENALDDLMPTLAIDRIGIQIADDDKRAIFDQATAFPLSSTR